MSDEGKHPDDLSDDFMAEGMRAAFRNAADRSGDSILATIEALSGAAPRILLRDVSDEDTPVIRPGGDEGASTRYQVIGELARGGVGVILKGRDVDLGRDVAMKVLREEHVKNPELLQRFVEEAQIGGQLQHPGIVPVYELGLQADRRPYFTMKLVKGMTLSELLADREDPGRDRQRYLRVFESVCQTVAYAHARGVVHRDLKPSNVMVGAFGEVQVVDWGFAKVLTRGGVADERRARQRDVSLIETVRSGSVGSESQAGSVLGTPAYMPPEQALGEVEKLTERSDVFSLGAILTEILTGAPAYRGANLLLDAARARLEDAIERLDACDADPELTGLAKRCLSVDPAGRPKDAGAVASAVGEYLGSIEDRARRAEVRAVKARAGALLAAGLLVVAVLAGGGLLWAEKERSRRVEQANRTVSRLVADAAGLRGRGQWSEALAAAERAVEIARAGDADGATREQAAALVVGLEEGRADARAEAERAARDLELVMDLTEIRTRRDIAELDRGAAYSTLLAEHGIDLDDPDAGRRIRESAVAPEIVGALDDLLLDSRSPVRLAAVLRDADPDLWRRNLREEVRQDGTDLEDLPLRSVLLFAESVGRIGRPEAAVTACRVAQREHPDDFWASFALAHWLTELPEPEWAEAAGALSTALALRPGVAGVRFRLGEVTRERSDLDGAIAHWREALRLDPDLPGLRKLLSTALIEKGALYLMGQERESAARAYREAAEVDPENAKALAELGSVLVTQKDQEGGIEAARAAVALNPDDHRGYTVLGTALGNLKRWDEAVETLRKAVELNPEDWIAWVNLLWAQYYAGDHAAVLATSEEVLPKIPESSASKVLWWRGGAHFGLGELDEAQAAYEAALERKPVHTYVHYSLGMLHIRAGRADAARLCLEEYLRLEPDSAIAHFRLAVILHQAKDFEGALPHYREALRQKEQLGKKGVISEALVNLAQIEIWWEGDLAAAAEALRQALREKPELVNTRIQLGMLLALTREYAEAEAVLRDALERGAASGPAHVWLSSALRGMDRLEEAAIAIRTAADAGLLDDEIASHEERLAELAGKVDEIASGEMSPGEGEARDFAEVCLRLDQIPAAYRLYRRACEEGVADRDWDVSYNAACAAARLGGAEARAWALHLLETALVKVEEASTNTLPLTAWRYDADLASVRGEEALSKLPPEEAERWRAFWKEVREAFLRVRAR